MTYIWFWVHWLAEDTPKSVKYQFTKFVWLTARNLSEEAKIIFEATISNLKVSFKKKPKSTIQQRKLAKMTYVWFRWIGWYSTPLNLLNLDFKNLFAWIEGTLENYFEAFNKKPKSTSNRENGRKWPIFDSGYNDWQNTSQNLLNIALTNLFDWLEEILGQEERLFSSYSL